jgi:hypothetical protein
VSFIGISSDRPPPTHTQINAYASPPKGRAVCGNPASTDLCRGIEENSERKYDKVFLEVFYSIIYGDPTY